MEKPAADNAAVMAGRVAPSGATGIDSPLMEPFRARESEQDYLNRTTGSLSTKLLWLTILFVLMAEVLIFVPSIANFRVNWLTDRLASARTAAMVLDAAPTGEVSHEVAGRLLESIGAEMVVLQADGTRRLLASADRRPVTVSRHVDLREARPVQAILDAFDVLVAPPGRMLRVVGPGAAAGESVEVVLDETPLIEAMRRFSRNIAAISIAISAITAGLVYFALMRIIVRPLRRLTRNMVSFRQDPENPAKVIRPSDRRDEIGVAERELAGMQSDISTMLCEKSRLAALGLAVSKINHDLRNMLASAQLFSDRIMELKDPTVQRVAPKLTAALERAIDFCQSTLSYGKVTEAPPQRKPVALVKVFDDVRELLALGADAPIGWVTMCDRDIIVDADPDQLVRVVLNLARNAKQVLESRAPNDPKRDRIFVKGWRNGPITFIEIADTGPGIPLAARAHLFQAFRGSTKAGGSGLGLAIAAELIRAHGGEIRLVEDTAGATFRLTVPDCTRMARGGAALADAAE